MKMPIIHINSWASKDLMEDNCSTEQQNGQLKKEGKERKKNPVTCACHVFARYLCPVVGKGETCPDHFLS